MRKVVFKDVDGKTKKLMLCQAKGGVYLFGYYSLHDSSEIGIISFTGNFGRKIGTDQVSFISFR